METQQKLLHTIAKAQAQATGLTSDRAEDCASTYLMLWLMGGLSLQQVNEAYIRKSAAYFAQNYRRKEARRQRREIPFLDGNGEIAPPAALSLTGVMLTTELHTILQKAIQQLSVQQRDVFVRHHFYGDTIEEMAIVMQKSPHSVEQTLYRARHRLREILERMGYDEATLREYLSHGF